MTAERRALFDALVEANARAKGLVFRPVVVAPIGSADPDLIFVAHFVEYADEAPRPGRYWNADEVPDAVGDEWAPCCDVAGCSWCDAANAPGQCPDCDGADPACTNCKATGRCLMCEGLPEPASPVIETVSTHEGAALCASPSSLPFPPL